MSGWILLGIGAVMAAVEFFWGLSMSRMTEDRMKLYPDGSWRDPAPARRVGRIVMLLSPLTLLVFAALAFGWIADTGIEPIRFTSASAGA